MKQTASSSRPATPAPDKEQNKTPWSFYVMMAALLAALIYFIVFSVLL